MIPLYMADPFEQQNNPIWFPFWSECGFFLTWLSHRFIIARTDPVFFNSSKDVAMSMVAFY